MRIIGGEYRGRRLIAPRDGPREKARTRPTSDRLRERIFNILEHGNGPRLAGARVADIFAGTGAMGLEALSRGAAKAVFVEKHRVEKHRGGANALRENALKEDALEENIKSLPVTDRAEILRADVRDLPTAPEPFDIIFMDPPYGRELEGPALQSMQNGGWISPNTLIVLELPGDHAFDAEGFVITDRRSQGKTEVLFLELAPAE